MAAKQFTDSNLFYVLAGVLLALLVNQGLAFALGTPLPIVAVESNSMVPAFSRGDILVLAGVAAGDIRVGDVIVYLPDGHTVPIVHRVIAVNEDGTVQTKGDANAAQFDFERRVTPGQIRGRELLIVPYLGWVKIAVSEAAAGVLRALGV